MAQPKSWRPFLAYVAANEPLRLGALEKQFSRDTVETAANCQLVKISENRLWVTFTDEGSKTLDACNVRLKRRAKADEAMELLEEAKDALVEVDTRGRFSDLRHRMVRFLYEVN